MQEAGSSIPTSTDTSSFQRYPSLLDKSNLDAFKQASLQ